MYSVLGAVTVPCGRVAGMYCTGKATRRRPGGRSPSQLEVQFSSLNIQVDEQSSCLCS